MLASLEMVGVAWLFHFSPRQQEVHSQFHFPQDGRGFAAISFFFRDSTGYIAIPAFPEVAGVAQPFQHSKYNQPSASCAMAL